MSASSAASSSLSRARTPVIVLTVIAAAYGIYYLQSGIPDPVDASTPSTGLHRSNAVHRRARRLPFDDPEPSAFFDEPATGDADAELVARQLPDGETVVDDQSQDDYDWETVPHQQRTGQNIVQLLFRVSEEATRRNAYVHRGCECNSCGVVPIRGVRYRCSNCADYDLCEGCESQGLHSKTHIFYKVKVPAPSSGPRHMQPVWYTGDPDTSFRPLQKDMIVKLNRETGFERPELDAYWEQWTYMANTEWREDPDNINLAMDRKTFQRCLVPSGSYMHSAPSLIFDRMFAFYDTNKDDLISFPEFLHGLAYRKKKDKWVKIFEVYDIDEDGYVERKDFLRIFRSYYVLYREMHRDLLDSMEEQQMSSTDAHRLITSRQPLSSAFGGDGRFPPAPDPRTGEGKTLLPNGDLEISDGQDVIRESSGDTGNRDALFWQNMPGRYASRPQERRGYWDAILNPPVSVEQLPAVLRNLNQNDSLAAEAPLGHAARRDSDNRNSHSDSEDSLEDDNWPPRYITVTEADAEAIGGPGITIARVSRAIRPAVIEHAVQRERIHREMLERWRKRQFYTDEEEGAVPPAGWKEEDDIMARSGVGESSKTPPRPGVHSRSSSKVRFAEELDDFDTRSNPSTSSRSVPERWGGMEIQDAERDAGKEILYQVTQQAFNELLDPFFKDKEDIALQAASTKADRAQHRHLYNTPEFEKWATDKEIEEETKKEEATRTTGEVPLRPQMPHVNSGTWSSLPDLEVDPRDQPWDELLAIAGYAVDLDDDDSGIPSPPAEGQSSLETNLTNTLNTLLHPRAPSSDLLALINTPPPTTTTTPRRDPTLPQFRPNSATSPPPAPPTPPVVLPAPPSRDMLFRMWKLDREEQEAERRKGWARLALPEFLDVVHRQVEEGRGSRMDYLGSWVEFCLP